jgi:tetratricopeptide (TPR) repeat protein
MRSRAKIQSGDAPAELLQRALSCLEQGRVAEAIIDLQAAARAPMLRFAAASELGRLYAAEGELDAAVEWLERAVESPIAPADDTARVLYELADILERQDEPARALAVLMRIDAAVPAFRDVAVRIEQLTRAQAGGVER